MIKIANKYKVGWAKGRTIISEVGTGDIDDSLFTWLLSDVGETGIKGYVGGVGLVHEGPHWGIKYISFVGTPEDIGFIGPTKVGEIG